MCSVLERLGGGVNPFVNRRDREDPQRFPITNP